MGWLAIVPYVLVAMLVLYLPGLLVVGVCRTPTFRVKPLAALAIAPAVSITLIAFTAIVISPMGIPWGPLPVLVMTLITVAIAIGVQYAWLRIQRRRTGTEATDASDEESADAAETEPAEADRSGSKVSLIGDWPKRPAIVWLRDRRLWALIAVALGTVLMLRQLYTMLLVPDALSQTYDNSFHANAVRWILNTGDGSTFTLLGLTGELPGIYPASWHDTVSLVLLVLGSDNIAMAANATAIVCATLVWISGFIFLAGSMVRLRIPSMLGAGVLAVSFTGFPLLMLDFGVLYAYFMGLCVLPTVVALTVQFAEVSPGWRVPHAPAVIFGVFGIGAMALSHPGVMMLYFVMMVVILIAWSWQSIRRWYRNGGRLRTVRQDPAARTPAIKLGLTILAILAVAVMWQVLRPAEALWSPRHSVHSALGQALVATPLNRYAAWSLGILMLFGIYACIRRRRNRWLVLAHLIVVGLWVTVSATPQSEIRTLLTGIWYNDPYRLAAALVITSLPLAVLGLAYLLDLLAAAVRKSRLERHSPVARLVSVLVVAAITTGLLVQTTQRQRYLWYEMREAEKAYAMQGGRFVDKDEMAVLRQIPDIVPPDGKIIGNAFTGAGMAYAISNRQVTEPHMYIELPPDVVLLNDHFKDWATMPEVCAAAQRQGIEWVLDFGTREVHQGRHVHEGIEELEGVPGFQLVASSGEYAKLYRVTACQS